ncbi:ABC transporter permease [Alkaliphilus transvaalensis]|uniref:ABC transporter permease n=1 Tax=Alkaliphilus transvaalensis TaxID=114628 RepID=UPI00047C509E|nr:ABC transporter permease [Alkaliphilus transvaalensis]
MILRSSYFMLKRMLRGYVGLVMLTVLPLALITVLGLIAGNGVDEKLGIPIMDGIAITMVFATQLFGGNYSMEYIISDLLSSNKWRMNSLPYNSSIHAFAIVLSCTIFTALQGLVIVLFTQWVYGVNWGNIGLVIVVLLALSTLSHLAFVVLVLWMKNHKTAGNVSTWLGLISIVLAGVWFPMPETGILSVISTYGNPLSLSQNAVYAIITGDGISRGIVSVVILIASSLLMGIVATYLGRRKLA